MVRHRVGQSAHGVSVGCRPRRPRRCRHDQHIRGFLGFCVENYEAITWAEELIEPARSVDHPRLAFLYVIASQCYISGRVDDAVGYGDAGQEAIDSGRFDQVPYGFEAHLGGAYIAKGELERCVEWNRSRVQSGRDTHTLSRVSLIISLAVAQSHEQAIAVTAGLIEAAEATANPWALSWALLAFGIARTHADPVGALTAGRRGLQVAEDSGNRSNGTHLATLVGRIEAEPVATSFCDLSLLEQLLSASFRRLNALAAA